MDLNYLFFFDKYKENRDKLDDHTITRTNVCAIIYN